MDVVHDSYEPSALSFFDHVFGFFSGVRQRGFQTTEEILRDGSFITAVGELEVDGNNLRLQASDVGPMFLTTATKSSLLRRFEEAKTGMLTKAIFCGAIASLLTAYILRKIYLRKKQERKERLLKETLERARKERRQRSRVNPTQLTDDQKCVVCVNNPKEVRVKTNHKSNSQAESDLYLIIHYFSLSFFFFSFFRSFVCHVAMFVCAKIVRQKLN